MSLIFADGFDNYATQTEFWDQAGGDCQIQLNTGQSRTGIGCLRINSGAFGPIKAFGPMTNILACTAASFSSTGLMFQFLVTGGTGLQVEIVALSDGSIAIGDESSTPVLQTAPLLFHWNAYNSVAVQIQNFGWPVANGIVTIWVNGVLVLHQTNVPTNGDMRPNFGGNPQYCDKIRLMGPGGIPLNAFHDDFYILDCSTPPNQTFLGALKIYSGPPSANGAVAWTPLAGTNWSEVNQIPPDGDTSYNSSPNIGDIDQYVYALPAGVPAASSIPFVQHELDMRVDSGSRSVASDVAGTVAATATALSNGYHIYPTPWDTNPATGLPWVVGDFPVNAGPKVTA